MDWGAVMQGLAAELRAADRAEGTVRLRRLHLTQFAQATNDAGALLHPDPLGWWAGTLAIATLLAWPAARQVVTRGADDTPVEQVPLQSPAAAPAPAPAVPAPAPAPATSLA